MNKCEEDSKKANTDRIRAQGEQAASDLDPAVERIRKKLLRLMIGSIAVTLIFLIAVLIAIVYKIMQPGPTTRQLGSIPSDSMAPTVLDLPKDLARTLHLPSGAQIMAQSLCGSIILLQIRNHTGQTTLIVYDYKLDQVLSRVTLSFDAQEG